MCRFLSVSLSARSLGMTCTIELKCIPFVETNPPVIMENMDASEVMSAPVNTFREVEKVATIVQVKFGSNRVGVRRREDVMIDVGLAASCCNIADMILV